MAEKETMLKLLVLMTLNIDGIKVLVFFIYDGTLKVAHMRCGWCIHHLDNTDKDILK